MPVLRNFEFQLALAQTEKTGVFTYNTARNIDIMGMLNSSINGLKLK